jgi:hypothetical protein
MNYLTRLGVFTLWFCGFVVGAGTTSDAIAAGNLRLAENSDGGGRSCSIPIPPPTPKDKPKHYNLADGAEAGCSDDDYSYFMLDNVPSTTLIGFSPDVDCPRDWSSGNNWFFQIKMYKQPTTTTWISILSLKGHKPGEIVKAGVMMGAEFYRSGDVDEELECVVFEVSDQD